MKNLVVLTLVSIFNFAFGQIKTIDVSKSLIVWEGKKITGKHEGTINFVSGTLVLKNNKITGGEMVVDMTTINTTDLTGSKKESLDKHLKNDDFFGVEKHPTAKIVFKKIKTLKDNKYKITADLTIKGIAKPIDFNLKVDNENTAITDLDVNRTLYDIKYGSGSFFENLGDKAIDNNFKLSVKLVY
jgi:polyisoprenoid-binding protein YceI